MSWNINFADTEKLKNDLAAADQEPSDAVNVTFPKQFGSEDSSVVLKLVPPSNATSIEHTFSRLKWHTHMSTIHGENVFNHYVCPSSHGENCPICKRAWEERKRGNNLRFKNLLAKETLVALAYVIEGTQDQEGKMRLYQFDWRVKKDIDKLINDDARLLDPSSNLALIVDRVKANGYFSYKVSSVKVSQSLLDDVNMFELAQEAPAHREALNFNLLPFDEIMVDEIINGRISYADSLEVKNNNKATPEIPAPTRQDVTEAPKPPINFDDFEDDIPF